MKKIKLAIANIVSITGWIMVALFVLPVVANLAYYAREEVKNLRQEAPRQDMARHP